MTLTHMPVNDTDVHKTLSHKTETFNLQDRYETETFDFSKLSRLRRSTFKTETRRDVPKNVSRPPRDRDVQDRDCIPVAYRLYRESNFIGFFCNRRPIQRCQKFGPYGDACTPCARIGALCESTVRIVSGRIFGGSGRVVAQKLDRWTYLL